MPAGWQPALDRMNIWADNHLDELPNLLTLVGGGGGAPDADGEDDALGDEGNNE